MTGVGGRPEVIIEGSDSMDGPWQEYNFLYKPGRVDRKLPFVGMQYDIFNLEFKRYQILKDYSIFRVN
jgi:Lipase maturation factor